MASEQRKPEEYKGFEDLAKKLMAVPKKELDKKVRQYHRESKSKRAKK